MATLESIRKRQKLLLFVIGFAIIAFVLGDFLKTPQDQASGFVGKVEGESLSYPDFDERLTKGKENWERANPNSILNQVTLSQIRNSIWDEYVKELLMNAEYELLGISVDDDDDSPELFDMFQGKDIHPAVIRYFGEYAQDPTTKEYDRAKVLEYLKAIAAEQTDPSLIEQQEQFKEWINYLVQLRKQEKYDQLVQKGMYVTSFEAETNFNEGNQNISLEYVPVSFVYIPDSLINVSESEVEDYYANHINDYQQEESRNVDFVVFTVLPSNKDDEDTRNDLDAIKSTFEAYEDFQLFVQRNSDTRDNIFNFVKSDGILDTNVTSLFNAEKGAVMGPYLFAEGNYRLAKLVDVQYRPDSVEARHILLTPDQNTSLDSVNSLIEYIKAKIESGKDFADLAQKYSIDKGSGIKGGDLGWFKEGVMVPEFNESCFTANRGDLTIVQSQFGVHLIEVTKRSRAVKKVKIAYVDRIVEPSSETYQDYLTQAAQFKGPLVNTDTTTFDDLVAHQNLAKRNQEKVLPSTQNISGLENSRDMIRWMNKAKAGDISDIFEFDNNYVVAILTQVNEEGDVPLEDVKIEIESRIRKQKKGEMIVEEINSLSYASLSELSIAMNSQVQEASKATFLSNQLQNLGNEPSLAGLISVAEKATLTNPIIGNNAVFVIKVLNRNEDRPSGDFSKQKEQMIQNLKINASIAAYNTIKEDAKIIDNRNSFY